MLLDIIAGARPNFIKINPIIKALDSLSSIKVQYRLIHTGQHFDKKMSGSFFEDLGIPEPTINLNAGGGTQANQTAAIMVAYEKILFEKKSDVCLVVGDVTSTLACAIVAKKSGLRVLHVEGGIRSNDMTMPEEINRLVTDSITDYFYTTSEIANQNLLKAGHDKSKIIFVGNTMIDTLLLNINKLKKPSFFDIESLSLKSYFVLTLHRPANVDNPEILEIILNKIIECSKGIPIVFPLHPRTAKVFQMIKLNPNRIIVIDPQPYHEFLYLVKNAKAVITDSGGITEETTVLDVPCLTLRDNTERPETITQGSNELVGTNPDRFKHYFDILFNNNWKKSKIPDLWDGKSSERIVKHILEFVVNR